MAEEGCEPVADEALADELVAIAIRAERCLRVVHVEDAEAVEPDRGVELLERGVERGGIGHVDAGGPPVAGVETDAEPRVAIRRVRERGELGDRPADRPACTGGVLHAEPEVVGRQLEELAKRGLDERDGFVEPEAEVRADVEDDRLGADRVRRLHRRAERHERVLAYRGIATREVDEVEGVTADGLDAGLTAPRPEPRDLLGRVRRRSPHPRALREDLDGVAADLLDAVDRLRDASGGGDVGAEEHAATILPP